MAFDKATAIELLDRIAADQRRDAEVFNGMPFTGGTVGVYFGNQGAAIAALAGVLALVIKGEVDDGAAAEE